MYNHYLISVICLPLAYIIGSVNFSIILLNVFHKKDPRHYESKNAGVTNIYRQSGVVLASIVLILDIIRSALVGIIAYQFLPKQYIPLVCLALILGNRFPCFHNLVGGKGVANYLGFTMIISPITALIGSLLWIFIFLIFRIPFIASFAMVIVLCAGTLLKTENNTLAITTIILTAILIIIFHTNNIIKFTKP